MTSSQERKPSHTRSSLARFLLPAFFGGLGGCTMREAVRVSSPRMVQMPSKHVKRRYLQAKDAEEPVQDGKKYGIPGVILAARQVRRAVTEGIVTLVRDMLAD